MSHHLYFYDSDRSLSVPQAYPALGTNNVYRRRPVYRPIVIVHVWQPTPISASRPTPFDAGVCIVNRLLVSRLCLRVVVAIDLTSTSSFEQQVRR